MANMNHYHKYLEKNEATQSAFRDPLARAFSRSRVPCARTVLKAPKAPKAPKALSPLLS